MFIFILIFHQYHRTSQTFGHAFEFMESSRTFLLARLLVFQNISLFLVIKKYLNTIYFSAENFRNQ